jgi:beta-mannanase
MNGDWYPWAVASKDRLVASVDQWRQAWRHVVDIARSRKATNVRFMFCPNTNDVGEYPAERYWPGPEYVDVIGVDGYNWGWNADGSPFTTAEQLIAPMYSLLTGLHPAAEFMVGEIGCAAHENKADWHVALFASKRFPRLSTIAFFHEKKEHDWRLNSDPRTLTVVRENVRAPRQRR